MHGSKKASEHTKSLTKVQSATRKKNKCVSGRRRGMKDILFLMKERTRIQEEADAAWDKQFGNSLPDRDVSSTKFEEHTFGSAYEPGQDDWCQLSKEVASRLSNREMRWLFACMGIALPCGTSGLALTRFLTSSRLVTVFNQKRNKDDKLKVAVRLPNKTTIPGILGLYDKHIAIVTSLGFRNVRPLDMYQETGLPDAPMIVATGRAYESCSLMGTTGALSDAPIGVDYEDLSASICQITEAGLGGPLIDLAGNLVFSIKNWELSWGEHLLSY